ncbi:MAG: serine/threonine protein kinase [Myxococcales bacterium]|nr:serine/threonine protein kinase [Myxococcales bacterium]
MHATNAGVCVHDGEGLVDTDRDPWVGAQLDRYLIEEHLGEGGMGCVYRARHTVLDREYAIKVLYADFANDQRFLARFRREAQSMSKVRHENIVNVEDFGTSADGKTFLVMELVRGRTLERIIREEAPLPPPRAAHLVRQIAQGLGAAHVGGIVHRDVKPANMMVEWVGPDERLKILDFGAVNLRSVPVNERLTHVGHIIGTPTYMAPEQSQDPNVGPTADLYALGVVLFEMLTGHPPFEGKARAEVLVKHITEPPPAAPPSEGLERLVAWLLEKLPSRRPQSTEQVVRFLDTLDLDSQEGEATAITTLPADRTVPTTPPTVAGPGYPTDELRQVYKDLAGPAARPVSGFLAEEAFPVLDANLDWANWSDPSAPLLDGLETATDEAAVQARQAEPPTAPTAAQSTQVVRDRLTQSRVEPPTPEALIRGGPTPMSGGAPSDDGGPTQLDFEVEQAPHFEPPRHIDPLETFPELSDKLSSTSERPLIMPILDRLDDGDASDTILDDDDDGELGGTVPLVASPSQLPLDNNMVTPAVTLPTDGGLFGGFETTVPPVSTQSTIPPSRSPPPPWQGLPGPSATTSPVPALVRARRRPMAQYLAIATLSVIIVVLAWLLWAGHTTIDLSAETTPTARSGS